MADGTDDLKSLRIATKYKSEIPPEYIDYATKPRYKPYILSGSNKKSSDIALNKHQSHQKNVAR